MNGSGSEFEAQHKESDSTGSADAVANISAASSEEQANKALPPRHHVSHILDDVLEEQEEQEQQAEHVGIGRRLRSPMFLDIALAISLLIATGGFSLALFQMMLCSAARQSLENCDYPSAIRLLKNAPIRPFYNTETLDLLDQAIYMDAKSKLDAEQDTDVALKELSEIKQESRFYAMAQELISDYTQPATEPASPNAGGSQ